MKQVLLSGKGEIEVFDVPVPAYTTNSVLVRNVFSLISTGTESVAVSSKGGILGVAEKVLQSRQRVEQVWNLARTQGIKTTWDAVNRKLNDYVALGYSCAGQVVEVSSEEVPFCAGDLVACMGGGYATHSEYVVVPSNLVAKIPVGVGCDEAAFGSIGSIAMHGIRRLNLTPGEKIGVLGLGLIGQLTVQLLVAMGFTPVGIDLLPSRAEKAKELIGIDAWGVEEKESISEVLLMTNGYGLDGVIVCASSKSDEPINLAFDLCRKGGRVSLVGDVVLNLMRAKMYQKEVELRMSCSYGPGRYDSNYEINGHDYPLRYVRWTERRNLEYFLHLLGKKKINAKKMITCSYPVEQATDAYAKVKKGEHDTFGVLINYGFLPEKFELLSPNVFNLDSRISKYGNGNKRFSRNNKVRLGIIGCGSFMKSIQLPNLKRLPELYEIIAIVSRSGSSAAVSARKYDIPVASSDYRYLLDDATINAVMVATRHSSHARIVLDALDAEKHVFVEKPMCVNEEEGRKIVEKSREKGLIVRIGFNRRFSPYLNVMKQAIGTKGVRMLFCRVNIGRVQDDWSNTSEEGGRLLGEGVHFFDLCNWFMEQSPKSVVSFVAGDNIETNPNVMVQIYYDNGCLAQILYTSLGNPLAGKEYFETFGNGRTAIMNDYNLLEVFGGNVRISRKFRGDKGHLAELREFAAVIQGNSYPISGADAEAGLTATSMARSVYTKVKINEIIWG